MIRTLSKPKSVIAQISLFFILFMIAHTVEVYLIATTVLKDNYLSMLFLKLAIWTLPVLLLTWKRDPFKYLKLQSNIVRGLLIGFSAGLIVFALRASIIYYLKGNIDLNFQIPMGIWINVIIFVGLSEEVVFRGYLLQKIEIVTPFWLANIISSILFYLMHFPIWIMVKNLGAIDILTEIRSMLLISLVLGYVFKKSQSLWSCMILHSLHNFAVIAVR